MIFLEVQKNAFAKLTLRRCISPSVISRATLTHP